MLGHLIRKEILDHLLSLRFIILSAIGALVIWLSLYDGYACYRECLQDYRSAQAATEDRLRQLMVADNWSEVSARGYAVHRPPTPLSIFIRGLEPTLGRSIQVAGGRPLWLMQSPAAAEPILGVFMPLDLGQVAQTILSLFVLLLTYDSVCGEKEGGTLRLVASFAVPKRHLLLGKLAGALIPMLAAFGLPLLLGIAVVLVSPEVRFTGSDLVRLGLIVASFVFYLAGFTCAGLLASCLTHRAATSFVLLLGFWTTAVAVQPRLSLMIAEGFRPGPSAHQLQTEKEALESASLKERYDLLHQWEAAYLRSHGQDWWKTPEGQEVFELYFSKTRLDARERFRPQQARMDETFRNRYNSRLDLAVDLGRFSPAFALNNATLRLADVGTDPHRRFLAAFDLYMLRFWDWFATTKTRDQMRWANPKKYGAYKWDVSDLPRFVYQEAGSEEDIQSALVDVGILVAWGLIFFVGAYLAMLRYDLR